MAKSVVVLVLLIGLVVLPAFGNPQNCELPSTVTQPSETGEASVLGSSGVKHSLYWIKLAAKIQPAKGTLFYLAGGPLPHILYTDLAAAFQAKAYPQFDVVLYDYYGFNCSSSFQDLFQLGAHFSELTMTAMASDFIQLKRHLIGKERNAMLMGGSHGAMLGAQIVSDYPSEIGKAVLFSGDTSSGWLSDGWFRFDRLLQDLGDKNPGFTANLEMLLKMASDGKIKVTTNGHDAIVDRPALGLALWLNFGMSSEAQSSLPQLIETALAGNLDWIAAIFSVELALLAPPQFEAVPTNFSVVTNFYRCNVWFPKSQRHVHSNRQVVSRFLDFNSFIQYWNRLCESYDGFGEFPFDATPKTPTQVPILSWVGDQDTFDPRASKERWSALSSNLNFEIMSGWSHDFGTDSAAGFALVIEKTRKFFETSH